MAFYDVIEKKKRGLELNEEEIRGFVSGAADGSVPDYQLSAMLMAIAINGMTEAETLELTLAIAESGDRISLPFETCDKHSTGGVGDCTTFIVAPVAAALGLKMLKISGRGLGFTGGTLDKLEAIKGFDVSPEFGRVLKQLESVGTAVIGQSGRLCPADKKLYALRDVTATVDSIPLIAASVMGKKLAAGAKNLALDVKCGRGAFMKNFDDAERLAKAMLGVAKGAGVQASAVITDMDMPLARAVGNAVEVYAAIEVLRGKSNNLAYVSKTLIKQLLPFGEDEAGRMIDEVIGNGKAFEVFRKFVAAQGGDVSYVDEPEKLISAPYRQEIFAEKSGYIRDIDAIAVASSVRNIGGGREKKEDVIDHFAGAVFEKRYGDFAGKGELLATVYCRDFRHIERCAKGIAGAIAFSQDIPPERDAVLAVIKGEI